MYSQTEKPNKIGYEINLKSKNSGCFNTNTQNGQGYITGVLFGSKEGIGTGVSSTMDWFFLNQLSEYSWAKIKSPDKLVHEGDWSKLFNDSYKYSFNDYTINYSFYPLKVKNDSIWVYCKYVLYERKETNGLGKYTYDVAFREDFLSFPFNVEAKFGLWKYLFPLSEMSIKFFFDIESAQNKAEEIPLAASEAKITELTNKSNLGKTNLKLGMELLRMNAQSDKIILQKNDYPLLSINKFWGEKTELKTTAYSGSINLPLKIYNPGKITAFENSKFAVRNQSFVITLIPISKEGNDYLFDVLINIGIGHGSMSYEKRIKIEANNKAKLELQPSHMTAEDIVDGERFALNLDEDYNAFVKDYLIISFESEGETSINLNAEIIKKMQENAYQSSKRSANRDNVVATITAIVADAQKYYWETNKKKNSFMGWKLPDTYKNLEIGTFSVEVYKESVKVTGIGKETGNDSVNPIKVIMIAVPEKISSTSILN